MIRSVACIAALGTLFASPAGAVPELVEPPSDAREAGMVWAPQPVHVTALDAVQPVVPHVPVTSIAATGEVEIGPERAAVFWVPRLSVVRVRPSNDAALRAARVVGTAETRAVIDESESLVVLEGRTRLLIQGPTGGDVWRLSTDAPATVRIERLARRPARVIWETARRDLLDRVDAPADAADLPALPGATTMARAVDDAAALAARVGAPPGGSVDTALKHWQRAVATDAWSLEAPFDADPRGLRDPLAERPPTDLALPLDAPSAFSAWITLDDGARLPLTFEGGGAVRLEARVLDPGRSAAKVTLMQGEQTLVTAEPRSVEARVDHARWGAFPDRRPLLTTDGRAVGPRAIHVVSLVADAVDATLAVDGGPALVRMTHARLRPMLDEALAGRVTAADHLAAARAALGDADAPAARLLIDGFIDPARACEATVDDPVLAAWAAVRCVSARPDADRFDALPTVLSEAERADPTLGWRLRLAASAAAESAGRLDVAVFLPLGPLPNTLPPRLAGEIAARRPRPPVDPAGARAMRMEEVWRRAPGDRDARSRLIESWRHTRWSGLRPAIPADGVPVRARRWLAVGLPPRPDEDDLALLSPLRPGATAEVEVPPLPDGAGRSRRLGLVAARPDGAAFDVTVDDGDAWRVERGAATESVGFAVAPGTHRLTVEGPDGLEVWVGGTVTPDPPVRGRVAWAWPTTDHLGRPLRVELPVAVQRRRVKLTLRAVELAATTLEVHTDIGPVRTIDLRFDGVDADARPLDDGPAVSPPVEVMLDLPPTTGGFTLVSADGDRLLVRPTLRTPALVPPAARPGGTAGAKTASPGPEPVAVVEDTSRLLVHRPQTWSARVRRVGALLDLDLTALARPDLDVLRYDAPPDMAATIDGLLARYSEQRDPAVLSFEAPTPVPLDPLIVPAATPTDAPRAALARDARAAQAKRDFLAAAGLHLRAYREAPDLALARAAQVDLRRVLDAPDAPPVGIKALAFGALARADDDGWRTGVVGLRGPAAAGSAWQTLESMENAAGYEVLRLPALSRFVPPALRVKAALLGTPWDPAEGHALLPGRGTTVALRLRRPTTLAAEVWCVPEPEDRPCLMTVRRGAGDPDLYAAPSGQKTVIDLGEMTGRAAVDVALKKNRPGAAAVRFVADRPIDGETVTLDERHVLRPFRERRVFRAVDRRPVQAAVIGPGAIRIEAWRPSTSRAATARLDLTGPDGQTRRIELPLDDTPDYARGEGRRPLRVSETRRVVVPLLAEGAYRVALAPDRGEALFRVSVRVDDDGEARRVPPPMAWRLAPFDPLGGLPTPLVPPTAADVSDRWRAGSLSVMLKWLQSIEDEEDGASARPPMIVELDVVGRRLFEQSRTYARLGPAVRTSLAGDLVAGGRAMVRTGLLGVGLELRGDGWTQPGAGRWSAGGRLSGWKSFTLAPDWQLIPGLRLWATRPAAAPGAGEEIDPVLSTDWRRDHRWGWRLGTSLRWQALREQHGRARIALLSNEDFASPDRLDLSVGWTALFGLGADSTLAARAGYRPSIRFADDDREDAGVAHGLWAGVKAGIWLERDTRLVLGAAFTPYVGLDGDFSPRFSLSVGIDFTGGRRLIDFTPIEEPYPDLAGRRFWLPPAGPEGRAR